MRRLMSWVSLLCLTGCIGVGAIQMASRSNDPFEGPRAALAPGSCPMPCFMGIRPGVTTMEQAVQLLSTNPYVNATSIHSLSPGENADTYVANWAMPSTMVSTASGKPTGPDIQVRDTPGRDVVNMIIVQVNIPLGDFLPLFGPPPSTSLTREPGPNGELFYVVAYPALGMQYDSWVDCRQGQAVASMVGTTYMLLTQGDFGSLVPMSQNQGWHGFSSRPFDHMAKANQCSPGESPLNMWFARLFGS